MKKKMAAVLSAAMVLTMALSGCGKDEVTESPNRDELLKTTTEATTAATEAASSEEATDATTAEATEVTTEETTEETITALATISNDYAEMAISDVTWDEEYVYFNVTCTNKDTAPVKFTFDRILVNGCEWYGGIYETVEAGNAIVAEAKIRQDSNSIFKKVDAYAFTQPDEIIFYPEIETEDREDDKCIYDPFVAYPTGVAPEDVAYTNYTPKDTDIVIIDEQDVLVVITSVNPKSYTDIYYLYVENRSDKAITVVPIQEGYSENGEECKPVSNFIQLGAYERSSNIIYLSNKEVTNFKGSYGVSDYETDRWGREPFITGSFDINVADYDLDNEE